MDCELLKLLLQVFLFVVHGSPGEAGTTPVVPGGRRGTLVGIVWEVLRPITPPSSDTDSPALRLLHCGSGVVMDILSRDPSRAILGLSPGLLYLFNIVRDCGRNELPRPLNALLLQLHG